MNNLELIKLVDDAFKNASVYEVPASIVQTDFLEGEPYDEMISFCSTNMSVYSVNFPWCGLGVTPIWAEKRVVASICYFLLEHPDISINDFDRAGIVGEISSALKMGP